MTAEAMFRMSKEPQQRVPAEEIRRIDDSAGRAGA